MRSRAMDRLANGRRDRDRDEPAGRDYRGRSTTTRKIRDRLPPMPPKILFNRTEAAAILGINIDTFRRLVNMRLIQATYVPGRIGQVTTRFTYAALRDVAAAMASESEMTAIAQRMMAGRKGGSDANGANANGANGTHGGVDDGADDHRGDDVRR